VISNNLKSSVHIAVAVNKANKIHGLIRSFTYIPLMKHPLLDCMDYTRLTLHICFHFTQQTDLLPEVAVSNYKKETAGLCFEWTTLGCVRSTFGTNCQKKLLRLPQSTASRDAMTDSTSAYVSRKDTSFRSIYRPHCLRGISYDDDDEMLVCHPWMFCVYRLWMSCVALATFVLAICVSAHRWCIVCVVHQMNYSPATHFMWKLCFIFICRAFYTKTRIATRWPNTVSRIVCLTFNHVLKYSLSFILILISQLSGQIMFHGSSAWHSATFLNTLCHWYYHDEVIHMISCSHCILYNEY